MRVRAAETGERDATIVSEDNITLGAADVSELLRFAAEYMARGFEALYDEARR